MNLLKMMGLSVKKQVQLDAASNGHGNSD